jgi:predicted AAA+ superfamily ATPase
MRRATATCYCNVEDTRLFGFGPADFQTFLAVVGDITPPPCAVVLDEVQNVHDWPRLVRALLDRGRTVWLAGSAASLLDRPTGTRLAGRHRAQEVFPFSYPEYLGYTECPAGLPSWLGFLDDGGFPSFLREGRDVVLQTILFDIIQRDVVARHGLRETQHVINLALFLLANTGQPHSLQTLTRTLAIPTVGQTSRYVEHLKDACLLYAVPKFSASAKQRVVAPAKYYAVDNGLRRANMPLLEPDPAARLENAVALHLRRQTPGLTYASGHGMWECDFITPDSAVQVCPELTPANRDRTLRGVVQGARLGSHRRAVVVTLDQTDHVVQDGVKVEVVPAWRWTTRD